MNTSDTDESRDERDDTPPTPGQSRSTRSTSRDLDAIAARLAAARPGATHDASAHDASAHDATAHDASAHDASAHDATAHDASAQDASAHDTSMPAKSDGDAATRARDAARIRSLIDRSPNDDYAPDARGYASALGAVPDDTAGPGTSHNTPFGTPGRAPVGTPGDTPLGDPSRLAVGTPGGTPQFARDDHNRIGTSGDESYASDRAGSKAGDEPSIHDRLRAGGVDDAPTPMRFPRQDELDDDARPMPTARPRRLARGLALGMTATAGLIIALGAYAGGGEIISDLIDGDTQPRAMAPTPIVELPSVIIDSTLSAADSIAQAEQLATFGELPNDTIRRAPFGSGRIAILPAVRRPKIGDTLRPQIDQSRGAEGPARAEPPSRPAEKSPSPTPAKPTVSGAAATRPGQSEQAAREELYRVQVRATPDRTEADRLAGRLRSRGAKNVTVTESVRNGATLYRVRYGSFTSEGEARNAARRDGHDDAWIVRR